MVEKKAPKIRTQSDYLSDSESSDDEVNPHLHTLQEERVYGTIKGSVQGHRQHCLIPPHSVIQQYKEDHQNS